jgi:hypothetical protein
MLRSGDFPAHVCWLLTIVLAVGSVFALKALNAKWLWMLQAATPFITFGMLGCLDIKVRPSSGENLIVTSVCYTVVSVPVLALLYAILITLDWTVGVFYVALLAKVLLWIVGHQFILKAQVATRSRFDRSQDESEERLQSMM